MFTFSGPQFVQIAYSDHRMVKCKVDIDNFIDRDPVTGS